MSVKLSKKLKKVLDEGAQKLLEIKGTLEKIYTNEEELKQALLKEIDHGVGKKLFSISQGELINYQGKITTPYVELSSEIVRLKEQKLPVDPKLVEEQSLLKLKLDILTRTIENKKQYHKRWTHAIDEESIDLGIFTTTVPVNKPIHQKTNEDKFYYKKNGLRIENEKGYILTNYDARTLGSLNKIWFIKGKKKKFTFKISELLKDMQLSLDGFSYNRVKESLWNLATTDIYYKIGDIEGIYKPITSFLIDNSTGECSILFHDDVQKRLENDHYVLFNMMLWNDFQYDITQLLYTYVTKKIKQRDFRIDADELINFLNIETSNRSRTLKNIERSFQELIDFDVIAYYEVIKEYNKTIAYYITPSNWILSIPMALENSEQISSLH